MKGNMQLTKVLRGKKEKAKRSLDNSGSGKARKILSKISGAFMLPISVMAIAGLFLGVGATISKIGDDANIFALQAIGDLIKQFGDPVFGALPLLFAAAFVISFTDEAGVGVFAAVIGYLIFNAVQSVFIWDTNIDQYMIINGNGSELANRWTSFSSENPLLVNGKEIIYNSGTLSIGGTVVISDGHLAFDSANNKVVVDGFSVILDGNKITISSSVSNQVVLIQKQFVGYKILFEGLGRNPRALTNVVGTTLGTKSLQTSAFGGISVGLLVQYLYNRFHTIQLPSVLSFFGGKRFVSIITIPSSAILALVFLLVWPWIGVALNLFGNFLGKVPYGFESFIFGYLERSLVPFGLHHAFYAPLWYTNAGGEINGPLQQFINQDGLVAGESLRELIKVVQNEPNKYVGDSTAALSLVGFKYNTIDYVLNGQNYSVPLYDFISDKLGMKIGRFLDGKFSFMIFGLPAAAFAMVMAAPKENRKVTLGTVIPAGVTALVTGVTEPIEFTFLFLAPYLFWGFHALLCALSFMIANLLGVHVGMAFSGGLLDLLIYGIIPVAKGTHFWWTLVVGLFYAPIYFFGFLFFIKKFNIETPGRGSNTKLFTKADFINKKDAKNIDPVALAVVVAYGGIDNITAFNNCASRLRYDVVDASKVDQEALKAAGAAGVKVEGNNHVQAIFGPKAEQLNALIKSQRDKIKSYLENNNDIQPISHESKKEIVSNSTITEVFAPAIGEIKELSTLNDGVFSEKLSGDGFIVEFNAKESATVFAPFDGEVAMVFPTKHAYVVKTKDDVCALLHIGIDTVKLNGEGFESLVQVGDKVKAGDKLAKVNLSLVKSKNLRTDLVTVILPESSKTTIKTKFGTKVTTSSTKVAEVK
ncbi:hypothetical protein HUN03_00178 [Mycoplasmopsis anatis]|uniref:Uncharacterized protein n=2 Tax=Mycoplasmopsis anatis TaxID=171279 RepID=A0A9Q3LB47_9BACT|nr:glucose PTS transporter subunit IIA [Mycoplasmopsis anatis]MBW0594580.1 hypothetical protein [Mycoplasmopsis anatis]MBW0595366.1 hypothetical protein [Mycoplasmopsis anatis]MBW0596267.1 hypothetical protein [Mycoplasmopsis anatis]MBW0597007.1 hypothetical protein [Mycoplasmopsis anatis]MBW0597299.1 hypothetical protein [Mycoplasmopsis anatis]